MNIEGNSYNVELKVSWWMNIHLLGTLPFRLLISLYGTPGISKAQAHHSGRAVF